MSKKIYIYNSDGTFYKEINSGKECMNYLNITKTTLQSALKDKIHFCKGFILRDFKLDKIEIPKRKKRKANSNQYRKYTNIFQYDLDGNFIQEFKTSHDILIYLEIDSTNFHILRHIDKYTPYKNFYWFTKKYEKLNIPVKKKKELSCKSIYKYDLNGEFLEITDCHKLTKNGFSKNEINQVRRACLGGQKSAKGFQWRYDYFDKLNAVNETYKKSEVYVYTNIITGEKYIGQTNFGTNSRSGKNGNKYKDCPKFYSAIQLYGWENFSKEIVGKDLDKNAADLLEKYYIDKFNSVEKGYNVQHGGRQNYKYRK